MPELPEVETTKLSLNPLIGKTVDDIYTSGHRLREVIPADLDELVGASLWQVIRRAKYLILLFKKENQTLKLLIHLGMSGSLQQHTALAPRKHDHVIFGFGNVRLHYHDPRRFGMVMWADDAGRYLDKLGVEPLSDEFHAEYLYRFAQKTTRPIKTLIMEQSVVVGVGNIYAVESLFLTGIHPATPACQIDKDKIHTLTDNIKMILAHSIKKGGSTLKDFTVGAGKTGYFQQVLLVYGRDGEPCTVCQEILENIKIGGRASVYCPNCQSFVQ
ncbi:MAG: bifunctional DNA-formamidopyrimidine glycosylase/DNA-(apurinic or apyrimidinic site) lyase [Moraxella sp.]|nr:bifunctional DNA-formamidopyrimidine glycosylase/DNA-(apurinic or apyrimidinic site) lyase [Moraxella sp.]